MTALRLLITSPSDSPGEPPAVVPLTGPVVLGRDPRADVVVDAATVSQRHGELTPDARGFHYRDLGSTNGSALRRAGVTTPCRAGEPILLEPGDTLLLGDLEAPVRIELERVAPPPTASCPVAPPPTRTIVARAPLLDLMATPAADDRLGSVTSLCARALAAESGAALAAILRDALQTLLPMVAQRGVVLWGPGLAAVAGDPVPAGLRELALSEGLTQAELAATGAALDLPQTQSLVATGTTAALTVPLIAQGASWGLAFASSPLGPAAFPADSTDVFALLGTLFAQAAAELSRRVTAANAAAPLPPRDAPLGVSPGFVEVVTLTRQVAGTDVPVLIHGETGSGKEVLARYLHAESRRSAGRFVAFNCAAIPENLIESELFGHVRGAFTSATSDRKGLFEEADHGTLFLDEIGEMPLAMQAKLLRVLQDGEVRKVGQNRPQKVDVRVVSATHRDLHTLAAEGRFRSDLMYRLNAITLTLPPLRDRPEDIPLLAHAFLARAAQQTRKHFPGFAPDALWALSLHPFPGNVRELDNEVLRAAALTPDGQPISAGALSPALRDRAPKGLATAPAAPDRVIPLRDAVAHAERVAIERALAATQGNISEAARLLEVTRPGLYKAMDRLGLK